LTMSADGGRLLLASASPRRGELIARFRPDVIIVPSSVEEASTGDPWVRVAENARAKALDVAGREHGWIVAADTVVALDGAMLGKPRSADEAARMLGRLSGRTHNVLSGLCVLDTATGRSREAVECTEVTFRALDDAEIRDYVRQEEPLDYAGGYAIQGRAALFVERLHGDFYNVMGLPLFCLESLLRELGASLLRPASDA